MGGRGRANRSRTQRKHFRDGRENVWKRSKSDPSADVNSPAAATATAEKRSWLPFATQNAAFDQYYKEQGIVSSEEWDTFMEVLRSPLPAAFRINSSSQFSTDIRLQLENDFMKSLRAEGADGVEVEVVKPLPWYPDNLAWHSNFSRMQLRKNQTLERFHEFLKLENEIGNITRQEAVSMVPPLFLDVRPEHFILDMCAAPGSKTFQLLEIIYQSTKPGLLPDGMIIANDLDVQRCNLLIHQTKRMCTANLIVTNNEAQHLPGCRLSKVLPKHSGLVHEQNMGQLLFDRVLCDVPCSGDGTLRKAPDLWRKWSSGMGNGLHNLQIQIAMRGLALLKVGGKMVYSTCSMNPVENEAVVAEILRKCGGSVELLDVSNECPDLVRRPGLRKWKVRDKGIWLASHKEVSKHRDFGVVPSMFPSGRKYVAPNDNDNKNENGGISEDALQPNPESVTSNKDLDEEVSDLPLERCMRIVPHDQNSGAFFIAVLQKVSPLPAIPENPKKKKNSIAKKDGTEEKMSDAAVEDIDAQELKSENDVMEIASGAVSDNEEDTVVVETEAGPCEVSSENGLEDAPLAVDEKGDGEKAAGKRKLQIQGRWKGVDPVLFFNDETTMNSIIDFYGIDESFPFKGHLISRNVDTNHVKRIYYVSKSVKEVLELNFLVGQQLKIASVGMKMFERQTSREGTTTPCSFRISSEGLPLILPHITKQILYASLVDFVNILKNKSIKYANFADAGFGEKASQLMMGCCVIVLKDDQVSSETVKVDASSIAIGCWKGRGSLSVMVTAVDCQELLERLAVRMGDKSIAATGVDVQVEQQPLGLNGNDQEKEITELEAAQL
ncbi:RNA cytosine-C(5)-methyltransferase NSUN2 [Linum perenne]